MSRPFQRSALLAVLIGLITAVPAAGQGRGSRGMMGDATHAADMQVFHQLFDHRTEITREVIKRENGIETVTESTNPDVVRLLQTHVESMLARVNEGRAIHRRDPLFAELFRYASQIKATHEMTRDGVRVIETSADPYVVQLLQAHADGFYDCTRQASESVRRRAPTRIAGRVQSDRRAGAMLPRVILSLREDDLFASLTAQC